MSNFGLERVSIRHIDARMSFCRQQYGSVDVHIHKRQVVNPDSVVDVQRTTVKVRRCYG